ncbi:MAG: hypothetical protein OEY79_00625 [Anaplasmataceae bacterium]|nr:hypothetical protein [Anaplasmataceae bacterium]
MTIIEQNSIIDTDAKDENLKITFDNNELKITSIDSNPETAAHVLNGDTTGNHPAN